MINDRPRIATRITADALRQVRSGHPWVYDGAITSDSAGEAGDLAVIFDQKRKFAAIGLWDPESPIRIRILHRGSPRTIDQEFWAERISAALSLRSSLVADESTTGWRCIHGENDQMPGFVADLYDKTLVIKIYSASWIPYIDDVSGELVDQLKRRDIGIERVILRHSRTIAGDLVGGAGVGGAGVGGAGLLMGDAPDGPVSFLENGLELQADVVQGQKTGHFLDQRDNRARVGAISRGKDVLDVFSCTGGFSLAAAAGGARSATSIDRSRFALATARAHFALNPLATSTTEHRTLEGDAFAVMETLAAKGDRFDVVVIDPPSFASRKADIGAALRAYERLANLGATLTKPGGTMMQCSCSSRVDAEAFADAIEAGVQSARKRWTPIETTAHGVDHPIGFVHGAYLKAVRGTIS